LKEKNNEICFTSIVPRWVGGTSLSLVVLKSYLLSAKPNLNISIHTFFSDDNPDDIARSLLSEKYQIFGFSIYMWNIETATRVTRLLKEENPRSFIIWGGPTASFDADPIIENNSCVDMIIKGEGEIPLLEVVSGLEGRDRDFSAIPNLIYRENGRVIRTPAEVSILDLEKQNHPLDIHAFEEIKTVYYETSRGCVFQCNYCAWNVNQCGIKGVRQYPLEKVTAELGGLFNLPQLEMLLLTDSNILLGGDRTRRIFSLINRLNRKRRQEGRSLVKINFEFNPEHLKESMLPEIKKLHVENYPIGLQSVNPEVLKVANRSFNKTRYVANIRKLREKIGAAILVEVIYGLPTDTYEGFKQTLEFVISELKADLFVCYRYSVLPGSVFWKDRERYGIRHEKGPPYLIVSSDTFSGKDLKRSQELAYYLQIIYRVFRSLKKFIDNTVYGEKIEIYEEIAALLKKKYGDFLKPKLVYDDGFLEDVAKLRDHKNAAVRHQMMADARRIIKGFASRSESLGKSTDGAG
jgi:radical SAM superfamily enzyme YgiQ (UPF0313 family)